METKIKTLNIEFTEGETIKYHRRSDGYTATEQLGLLEIVRNDLINELMENKVVPEKVAEDKNNTE